MDIAVEISQNRFLAVTERQLHAALKITARARPRAGEPAASGHPPGLAEVIVIDCSGSMGNPPTKMAAARRATAAAIEALPDGVGFAIVEGTHEARLVYPYTAPGQCDGEDAEGGHRRGRRAGRGGWHGDRELAGPGEHPGGRPALGDRARAAADRRQERTRKP